MKNKLQIFTVLLTLLFSASLSGFAQDSEAAISYNNRMIKIQSTVDQSLVDLIDAIDSYDAKVMNAAKTESLEAIKIGYKDLSTMENFDGSEFKKEMKLLLNMYKSITTKELTSVIKLIGSKKDLTDSEWEKYDLLFDGALKKYNASFERFNAFQNKFASDWNFVVEE